MRMNARNWIYLANDRMVPLKSKITATHLQVRVHETGVVCQNEMKMASKCCKFVLRMWVP